MKPINDYYSATRDGRIYSNRNNIYLKSASNGTGYLHVRLGSDGTRYVHRLVAMAHIPNPENKPEVNHKDYNRENNHKDNLEWVTHIENSRHAAGYNEDSPFDSIPKFDPQQRFNELVESGVPIDNALYSLE